MTGEEGVDGVSAVYLVANPPARDQFRSPRRATPSGVVVVHTAESAPDYTGRDDAAENVAAFIRRRSDAGSYHDLCDSDSIVQLVRYSDEAYGDVTGMDVWVRGGPEGEFRLAADVPPSQQVVWHLPASGVEYEARARAIGENGTSTWSEWVA